MEVNFTTFLQENSLYKDDTSKATLMANNERLMDSLMFNYFGFLGLYALNDSRSMLKTYETTEGELVVKNIGDTNHDVSLSVKMAFDANLISKSVVDKMTKLLVLIKGKQIKGKDLDVTIIRKYLDEIHYSTNKPSTKVYAIIKSFHDANIDLPTLAFNLYQIAKNKDYKAITEEFRNLVLKGQYTGLFKNLRLNVKTAIVNANIPPAYAAGVQDDSFFSKLYHSKTDLEFKQIWLDSQVAPKDFNTVDFTNWYESNIGLLPLEVNFAKLPIYIWLDKDYNFVHANLIEAQIDHWLKASINTPVAFIEKLGKFNANDLRSFYEDIFASANSGKILQNYVNYIDSIQLNNKMEVLNLKEHKKILAVYDSDYNGLNLKGLSTLINERTPLFNKTTVFALLGDLITIDDPFKFLTPTFGLVIPDSKSFKIYQDAYNNASKENQKLYDLLIDYKFKDAQIVKDAQLKNLGELWGKYLTMTDWVKIDNNAVNAFNLFNLNDLTESDIKVATQIVVNSPKYFIKYYKGLLSDIVDACDVFSGLGLNSNGKLVVLNVYKVVLNAIKHHGYTLSYESAIYKIRQMRDDKLLKDLLDYMSAVNLYADFFNAILETRATLVIDFTDDVLLESLVQYCKANNKMLSVKMAQTIYEKINDPNLYIRVDDLKKYIQNVLYYNGEINLTYIKWALSFDKNLVTEMVTYFETKAFDPIYNSSYILKFLNDDQITDKMVINIKKIWSDLLKFTLNLNPTAYKFSPYWFKLVKEFMRDNITTNPELINELLPCLSSDELKSQLELLDPSVIENFVVNNKNNARILIRDITNETYNVESLGVDSYTKIFNTISTAFKDKSNYKKALKDEITHNIATFMLNLYDTKASLANTIFENLDPDIKTIIIKSGVDAEFVKNSVNAMFNDKTDIKPYSKLSDKEIMAILKYNKISVPKITAKKTKTLTDLKTTLTNQAPLTDLKVTKIEVTDEFLERRSVEYDVFNKYKHGNFGIKFLREFDVNLPIQQKGQTEFLKTHDSNKLDPVFHGTGSIAASMILRYGFAVIKSNGVIQTTGKLLGDGIYFSNVLDKVAQYTSDSGYTRGIGTKGYIFQMSAELGKEGVDYEAAGLGSDNIRSPEWCVFDPNNQLKIYKAFEVEIVDKTYIDQLKQKYNLNENFMELKTFTEFLREAKGMYKNTTTYTFMDGTIPVAESKKVDFTDFKPSKFGSHVRIEDSQNGVMVIIDHDLPKSEAFCVAFTSEFMDDTKDLNKFLNLLNGK